MIITGPQPARAQPTEPPRSTLSMICLGFSILATFGGIGAFMFAAINADASSLIGGILSLVAAAIFYGLAEFFQQSARSAVAIEETARLLRERR